MELLIHFLSINLWINPPNVSALHWLLPILLLDMESSLLFVMSAELEYINADVLFPAAAQFTLSIDIKCMYVQYKYLIKQTFRSSSRNWI